MEIARFTSAISRGVRPLPSTTSTFALFATSHLTHSTYPLKHNTRRSFNKLDLCGTSLSCLALALIRLWLVTSIFSFPITIGEKSAMNQSEQAICQMASLYYQDQNAVSGLSRWSGDVIQRTGTKTFNAVSHNRARPYFRIQHGKGEIRARRVYLNVHSVTGNVVNTEWSVEFWRWKCCREFGNNT